MPFKQVVKTKDGEKYNIMATKNMKVSELKAKVAKKLDPPENDFILGYANIRLDDDNKTLQDYHIEDGDVVLKLFKSGDRERVDTKAPISN